MYKKQSITVETSLLIILLKLSITSATSRLKLLSGTGPGKDLSVHALKIPAVS